MVCVAAIPKGRAALAAATGFLVLCLLSSRAQALPEDGAPGTQTIPLWPQDSQGLVAEGSFVPFIEPYLVDTQSPRGAVLICPGGGYTHRAGHEAGPVARRFNEAGLHAFVVQYRVAPDRHPLPLLDAGRALRIVRARSEAWRVKPDKIAILGFSAGGHLAGTLGVHFDDAIPALQDEIDRISARPDALILCYAVIAKGDLAHFGSMVGLLGEKNSQTLCEYLSLERHVTPETPPTFLWHSATDDLVPVSHSLAFANALSQHEVPFELHIYPTGGHGMGLAESDPHIATWPDLACQWLKGMGW